MHFRFVIFIVLLVDCCGSNLRAQDEESFLQDLEKVKRLTENRQWDSAAKVLDALLLANANEDYVRYRKAEIVELKRRVDFRKIVKEPNPKTLVGGKLHYFNRTTGKLKLSYDLAQNPKVASASGKGRGVDFIITNGLYVHLAIFAGLFSASYETTAKGNVVYLLFGKGDYLRFSAQSITARERNRKGKFVAKPKIKVDYDIYKGGKRVDFGTENLVDKKKERRLEIKIAVGTSTVQFSANGMRAFKVSKTKDVFGRIAVDSGARVKLGELVLQGKCEPAFLQDRIDLVVGQQRKSFEFTWSAKKVLPGWLFIAPKPVVEIAQKKVKDFPGKKPMNANRTLKRLDSYLNSGLIAKGMSLLQKLTNDDVDEVQKAWFYGNFYSMMGRFADARRHVLTVTEKDPKFLRGRLLELHIRGMQGERKAVLLKLKELQERFPLQTSIYETLIRHQLFAGEPVQGKATLDKALRNGLSSQHIEFYNRMLVKATQGPNFGRRYEVKSEHYHVISDIDTRLCHQATRELEKAFRSYEKILFKLPKNDKLKFKVYLFSGRSSYEQYGKGAFGSAIPGSAGVYSPLLKQLLVWNLPQRDEMIETIRHEGFHQYIDRFLDFPPRWLNEGMATYFETAKLEHGKFKIGLVRRDYLRVLRNGAFLRDMTKFFNLTSRQFLSDNISRNYAQSWALVYFLLHSTTENHNLYDELLRRLRGGEIAESAVEAVFTKVDNKQFFTSWTKFLQDLSKTELLRDQTK